MDDDSEDRVFAMESGTEEDISPTTQRGIGALPVSAHRILVVELCERLAFHGMVVVLMSYMMKVMLWDQPKANAVLNGFIAWAYGTCLIGGAVADGYLGKVATITVSGVVYLAGLAVQFLLSTQFPPLPFFFFVALVCIGLGTGGIKANVSPLMADQLHDAHPDARSSAFRWFYWAINIGAFIGQLACPFLLQMTRRWDPSSRNPYTLSFFLPLLSFCVALLLFYKTRSGYREFHAESNKKLTAADCRAMTRPCCVFLFFPLYWLVSNQAISNFVVQAEWLDRPWWVSAETLVVLNALTLAVMIPVTDRIIKGYHIKIAVTTKILIGLGLAVLTMFGAAWIQVEVEKRGRFGEGGEYTPTEPRVSVWWQAPLYILGAFSEIFASIGGYEFAYEEAPPRLRSTTTALYLMTSAAGAVLGILLSPLMSPTTMISLFTWLGLALSVSCGIFWWCFVGEDEGGLHTTRPASP